MLQFSDVGETEALPAMSPFAMRNENLVVNRSTVRGNPIVEPAISRAPPPLTTQPPPTYTYAPSYAPTAPTAPATPPAAPAAHAALATKLDLPSIVYVLLGMNAITIVLCLTLILARR
jgi:hypothetical protein